MMVRTRDRLILIWICNGGSTHLFIVCLHSTKVSPLSFVKRVPPTLVKPSLGHTHMHITGKHHRMAANTGEECDLVKSTSCAECRNFKTRCWPDSQIPDGPCLRCQRLELVCQRVARKRGRKAPEGKRSRPKKLPHVSQSQSAGAVPIIMQTSFAGGLMTPSDDNRDGDGSTGTPPPGTLLPPTGYNQHGSTSIFEGFTSRGNSFAEGLELVSAAADHHRSLLSSFQDPILTGILTMEDAENLVSFYFANLQDCICLLDPQLHTAVYMRQNSMTASKCQRCHSNCHFGTHLSHRSRAGNLHPYWKQATDDTGWLRIGHACRLGYKLELHTISDTLPQDPIDARKAMVSFHLKKLWIPGLLFHDVANLGSFAYMAVSVLHRPSVHYPPSFHRLRSLIF
ncbi:hypothetical protein PILCRDRAFT_268303 [Piloderma croceum F 1598]|uniref:Zn(2)-C6 fungal-type domain-containing protein n=1 Tax=Piloderma croceum (strain F 1598) TaxID=765440 RepID=A0A0C3GBK0_PILCF|nr:hypothetical protein PILCRDRAFT_268303 [Piloderma croceum F 1598]